MDEPLRCEVRRGADSEPAAALALQQLLGSIGDPIEGIAQDSEIGATCLGDHQPLSFAIEQLQSKLSERDDRMLADIGLTRSDLREAARQPLWRDPTAMLARRADVVRINDMASKLERWWPGSDKNRLRGFGTGHLVTELRPGSPRRQGNRF
jgi:Domain of unknown function (DUF1127)